MALAVRASTRLEKLAEIFRQEVYEAGSGDNILNPVMVTVQTQGVATWLKQYIATHSPVAMNMKLPFLRSAIEQILQEHYPQAEELSRHSIDRDTWRLFHYFTLHSGKNEIPELDAYLRNDPDRRKQYQISRQIANTFEQYRTYRPELIETWRNAKGAPAEWQEKIFRELFANDLTFDYYISRFIDESKTFKSAPDKKMITVFGISSMPPFFFEFFEALANYQDVLLLYLAPASDYWTPPDKKNPDKDQNPLLQAFGVQGYAFFEKLISSRLDPSDYQSEPEPDKKSFLSALQMDIRKNFNLEKICEPDGTILIENCHTPLREVEVLHDRLQHEIRLNSRKPGDILVTAPDIEQYVPYIETVFGTGPLADCYTIADRSLKYSGTILPGLLQILHLPDSNYSSADIFSLLEIQPLQKKFSLDEKDILQLKGWCNAAGVRWGIDGEHREKSCGVNFEDYSWLHGIRRLLLGYAVSEDFESQLGLPELPLDFAEGAGAEKLGNFLDLLKELFCLRECFSGKKTPKEWFGMLKEFPDKFFLAEEPVLVEERAQLIRFLSDQMYESGVCEEEIPFQVIRDLLENTDSAVDSGNAFLRGKITFCSMVPMRTIPLPVIAILGLNPDHFPRKDIAPGFNLIAKNMRKTDRSKNLEDRYLLLETLLAAREKLMIFYNGQNKTDNSEVFPTPPLAELIQYLDRLSKEENRTSYLIKHSLQSYAECYFDGSDPLKYSYSEDALDAAKSNRNKAELQPPALDIPDLNHEDLSRYELPEQITLKELEEFFTSPVKYYLSHRKIGNFREYKPQKMQNDELFLLNPLENNSVKQQLVSYAAEWIRKNPGSEVNFDQLQELLWKSDQLPCREVGAETFENLRQKTEKILAEAFLQLYSGQQEESFSFRIPFDSGKELLFSGKELITPDHKRSISFRTADLYKDKTYRQKYLLPLFLRHLFLSAALPEYTETICQFEDCELIFQSIDQTFAREKLLQLIRIRALGKEKPVPFFREVKLVEENPVSKNGKPKKSPVESETYRNGVLEAISHDYCAALFFRETDLDQTFLRYVCRAVQTVYQGMELNDDSCE